MSKPNVNVTSSKVADLIDLCIASNVVPMLIGKPGIGKSAHLQNAAEMNNLKYEDVRLTGKEAADIGGIPNYRDIKDANGNVTGQVTTFVPTDLFPLQGVTPQEDLIKRDSKGNILYEADGKTPQCYNGWLVNLEEFTSADDAVQSACYQLILDRAVGKYKLHDNVYLVACGNGADDGAIASKVGTAIKSRVTTVMVEVEYKAWMAWAAKNNIHQYIIDYLSWRPENLHKFDPNSDDINFPCPRTWTMLSNIIETEGSYTDAVHTLSLGTIGKTAAEFKNFTAYYAKLPKIADILKNPTKADVPTDVGQLYALSGVMAQAILEDVKDSKRIGSLMDYIERTPKENQTITMSNAIRKNRRVVFDPRISDWAEDNAALIAASL